MSDLHEAVGRHYAERAEQQKQQHRDEAGRFAADPAMDAAVERLDELRAQPGAHVAGPNTDRVESYRRARARAALTQSTDDTGDDAA